MSQSTAPNEHQSCLEADINMFFAFVSLAVRTKI